MKNLLRVLIIVASIALGLYVGIWLMFVGGIVQVVNAIIPLNGLDIAIGICRIIFCEIAGVTPFVGFIIAGLLD